MAKTNVTWIQKVLADYLEEAIRDANIEIKSREIAFKDAQEDRMEQFEDLKESYEAELEDFETSIKHYQIQHDSAIEEIKEKIKVTEELLAVVSRKYLKGTKEELSETDRVQEGLGVLGTKVFSMPTIIKKLNRYNEPRYLEKVDDNTFLVYGESMYMRFSGDTSTENFKFTMIDFEGGPFLEIKSTLEYFELPNLEIVGIEITKAEGKENCFNLLTKEIEPS